MTTEPEDLARVIGESRPARHYDHPRKREHDAGLARSVTLDESRPKSPARAYGWLAFGCIVVAILILGVALK